MSWSARKKIFVNNQSLLQISSKASFVYCNFSREPKYHKFDPCVRATLLKTMSPKKNGRFEVLPSMTKPLTSNVFFMQIQMNRGLLCSQPVGLQTAFPSSYRRICFLKWPSRSLAFNSPMMSYFTFRPFSRHKLATHAQHSFLATLFEGKLKSLFQ